MTKKMQCHDTDFPLASLHNETIENDDQDLTLEEIEELEPRLARSRQWLPIGWTFREEFAMKSISAFLILLIASQFTFGQSDSWDNLRKLHRGQKIEVVDMKLKSFQGTFINYSQEMVSLRV